MPDASIPPTTDLDEILVKGEDGKFYILKGDTLVPAEGHGGEEAEVQSFAGRAGSVGATPAPSSPGRFVQEVIQTASLMVPDAIVAGRLEKAVVMFFKDLRDRLETKEALMRGTKVGGVGLTEVQVDTLLRIAEEKRGEWLKVAGGAPEPRSSAPVSVPPPPRPTSPSANLGGPRPIAPPVVEPKPLSTPPVTVTPPTPKAPAPPPNLPIVAEKVVQAVVSPKPVAPPAPVAPRPTPPPPSPPRPVPPPPAPKPTPPPAPMRPPTAPVVSAPPPLHQPTPTPTRPLVTDVLPPQPRAVGPVDELRYELPAFRRLGDPKSATTKVFEKIKLLLSEGWTTGMGALTAWRASPVMGLVHTASRESILTNTAMSDVITNTTRAGKPMVTLDEWKECIALSKKLDLLLEGGI